MSDENVLDFVKAVEARDADANAAAVLEDLTIDTGLAILLDPLRILELMADMSMESWLRELAIADAAKTKDTSLASTYLSINTAIQAMQTILHGIHFPFEYMAVATPRKEDWCDSLDLGVYLIDRANKEPARVITLVVNIVPVEEGKSAYEHNRISNYDPEVKFHSKRPDVLSGSAIQNIADNIATYCTQFGAFHNTVMNEDANVDFYGLTPNSAGREMMISLIVNRDMYTMSRKCNGNWIHMNY